jgi:hypothetical protein
MIGERPTAPQFNPANYCLLQCKFILEPNPYFGIIKRTETVDACGQGTGYACFHHEKQGENKENNRLSGC